MNIKRIILIFTAFYLFCEIIYNLGLVEFLSSPNTEISVYNRLEFFGKSLASIGLSLFIIKLSPKWKQYIFLGLVPSLFFIQSAIFEYIIETLPADVKLSAYITGVYRNASLNKVIQDERLTKTDSYHKVLTSSIVALNNKDKQKNEVEKTFALQIDSSIVDSYYENYKMVNEKIGSAWGMYSIESKRWSGYDPKIQAKIDQRFIQKSGGIPRGLSKNEFMLKIADKSISYKKYLDMVIVPGNQAFGIQELKGKDIPFGMSKEKFSIFMSNKIQEIMKKTSISEENIEKLPHSKELISSVVIPPIAITLSLFSIILNASVLLLSLNRYLVVVPAVLVGGVFYTYNNNPYNLSNLTNKAIGVEATFHQTLNSIATVIHKVSINDENPNELEVIRVKKPEPIDFKDLEEQFTELANSNDAGLPQVDTSITVDEKRLETDKNYYGEVRKSGAINPYTGKPY